MIRSSLLRSVAAVITLMMLTPLTGCEVYQRNPRTVQGAGIGAATGAASGAAVGAIVGGKKGAGTGAAIGSVVGLLGGTAVGAYLDSQAREMEVVLAEQDRVRREQERLTVTMASDVLFTSGSSDLLPGARGKLQQFAGVLNRYPQSYVQVTGHTDSRGTEQSNMTLSQRRAAAVADELTAAGVSRGRLSTRGVGESVPIATNETTEGRAQNRRVDIVVDPDESLPAPAAGSYEGGGYEGEPR